MYVSHRLSDSLTWFVEGLIICKRDRWSHTQNSQGFPWLSSHSWSEAQSAQVSSMCQAALTPCYNVWGEVRASWLLGWLWQSLNRGQQRGRHLPGQEGQQVVWARKWTVKMFLHPHVRSLTISGPQGITEIPQTPKALQNDSAMSNISHPFFTMGLEPVPQGLLTFTYQFDRDTGCSLGLPSKARPLNSVILSASVHMPGVHQWFWSRKKGNPKVCPYPFKCRDHMGELVVHETIGYLPLFLWSLRIPVSL